MQTPDQKAVMRDPLDVMMEELEQMQRRGELAREINPKRERPVVIDATPEKHNGKGQSDEDPEGADGIAV
jgi:hypothetical protein